MLALILCLTLFMFAMVHHGISSIKGTPPLWQAVRHVDLRAELSAFGVPLDGAESVLAQVKAVLRSAVRLALPLIETWLEDMRRLAERLGSS